MKASRAELVSAQAFSVPVVKVSLRAFQLMDRLARGQPAIETVYTGRTLGVLHSYGLIDPDPHTGQPRLSDRGYRLHSVCAGILGDQVNR